MLARRTIPFALSLACLCAPTGSLRAQDTTQVRPDSSTRAIPPKGPAIVPVPEPEVPRGPLAPGSRHTFTRDSLAWTNAQTLADLLGAIPGVYVARAGFIGQPEYVVYGGRGAATLDLYWDGMPMAPVGGDSIYQDVARIYLTNLRRVDVEVLPATLRVYLVSERHETLEDRTLIRVMSGDFATAQYAGLFQRRFRSGLGLGLGGNFTGSNGFSGANRSDHVFDVSARLEWLPSPRAGMVYQIRRQNQDRDAVALVANDTIVPFRKGVRTDAQFRAFATSRPHGGGWGAELLLGSSGWGRDSMGGGEQGVHHVATTFRYTHPRAAFELTGRLADIRVTRSVTARAAMSPLPWVVLTGDAGEERLTGHRGGRRAHGAVALFRGPLSVVGEVAWADAPQAPALRQDTAQRTLDRSFRVGFDTRVLSGHGGLAERDAYAPLSFPDLPIITALNPSARSTVFLGDAKLQLLRSLTLDGWYANPVRGGSADFQPPTHGRVQVTFRSKFWRTFRSGAFDLKVQVATESWSAGTAGISAAGQLTGITFYEAFLSFQIVGFTAFYDLRNAYNSRVGYVPGMPYPRNGQTFGVRWEFFN